MPRSGIIKEHRMHLIARSLDRNPLLSFSQGKGKIDVCTLFEGVSNGQERASEFFRKLIEQGEVRLRLQDNSAMDKRLHNIRKEADLLNRTTGEHSLFFAWPFITIPRPAKKNPLSTALFFWDIYIDPKKQEFIFKRSENSVPRYNYMLEAWLQKIHNRGLPHIALGQSGDVEDVDDKGAPFAAIRKQIDDFCNGWEECQLKLTENLYELHTLSKHNDMLVSPHAVIGTANFKYMALLSDLEKLENKVDNDKQRTLLDEVIGDKSPGTSEPPENNVDNESEKYLVEDSDVSQEKVVWQTRKSKITFLDGPPGTGKSQTIVNLIADSLQRNEKVMLVCHQQAALNVVKKRLTVKLDGLSLLITDARAQRKSVIDGIMEIRKSDKSGADEGNEREIYISKIEELENDCNQITTSLSMEKTEKFSMRGNFRGIIKKIEQETEFSPSAHSARKFMKDIDSYAEELLGNKSKRMNDMDVLSRFALEYDQCCYDSNKWKDVNPDLAPKIVNNVNEQFNKLVESAKKTG